MAKDTTLDWFIRLFLNSCIKNKNAAILDVGCGSGRAMNVIRQSGFTDVKGIDVSRSVLSIAVDVNGIPKTDVKVADITKFRPRERYSGILASDIMLYIPIKDQLKVFRKFNRMLEDNGYLAIRWAKGGGSISVNDGASKHLVPPEHIKELLRISGFDTDDLYMKEKSEELSPGRNVDFIYAIAKKKLASPAEPAVSPAAEAKRIWDVARENGTILKLTDRQPKIKAIVLDFDGTVADTLDIAWHAWRIVYGRMVNGGDTRYFPPDDLDVQFIVDFINSCGGGSVYEQMDTVLAEMRALGVQSLRSRNEYVDEWETIVYEETLKHAPEKRLLQESKRFLDELLVQGYIGQIIQTSGKADFELQKIVDYFGLRKYFGNNVHGARPPEEDSGLPRNKEEVIRQLLAQGLKPDEIIMIGDGKGDMDAAVKCGVLFAAVAPTAAKVEDFRKPGVDFIIRANGVHKDIIPHLNIENKTTEQLQPPAGARFPTLERAANAAISLSRHKTSHDIDVFYSGISSDMPLTVGGAERIKDILVELLANALKFGQYPEIYFKAERGSLVVDVKDTGCGIYFEKLSSNLMSLTRAGLVTEDTESKMPRVELDKDLAIHSILPPGRGYIVSASEVERFIADNRYELPFILGLTSQDERIGHGGVGLYLARRYARNMGGDLTYVTGSGSTTFTLRIPLSSVAAPVAKTDRRNYLQGGDEAVQELSDLPAVILEKLKNSGTMMVKALDRGEGVGLNGPGVEMLVMLGILARVDGRTDRYCFTDMMRGDNTDYTRTLINAINDIRYKFKGEDEVVPLRLSGIKEKYKLDVMRELVKMTILNQIDIAQKPAIPSDKILWHILEEGVVSPSQRGSFAQEVNSDLEEHGSRERIYLWRSDATIEQVIRRIQEKCPNAIFDVAVSSVARSDQIPGDIKRLVFEGNTGDVAQLEGVIAALRALHGPTTGDIIATLKQIYSVLDGNTCPYDIKPDLLDNPIEFARKFIFKLPPITRIPDGEIRNMNARLRQLLVAA